MRRSCFLLVLLLISGCIQKVVIEPPKEREIVVKCILKNDVSQVVELYYSGGYGDTQFDPVVDAEVMIITEAGTEFVFVNKGEGRYERSFLRPASGSKYILSINVPGRETITAETVFPEIITVDTRFFPPESWIDDYQEYYDRWIEFNSLFPWAFGTYGVEEMKETGGTSILSTMPGIVFQLTTPYPEILYIVGMNQESGRFRYASELATNHLKADPSNLNRRMYHQKELFPTDTSIKRTRLFQSVFSVYEGLPLHDDYIRIASPGAYDNGLDSLYGLVFRGQVIPMNPLIDASSFFSIVGDISYHFWDSSENDRRSSLFFCSVSQEYDRYLQDCRKLLQENEGDVLATLYSSADQIYSNINGASGIFGAVYSVRHDCDLNKYQAGEPIINKYQTYPFDVFLEYPAYQSPLPEL